MLATIAPFAKALGLAEELRAAVGGSTAFARRGPRIVMCQLDDDFVGAAELFAAMGNPTLEARQRLYAGERLLDAGSHAEGEAELQRRSRSTARWARRTTST